ncbi:hypothetical protein QC762_0023000 [Podospora pseudocomata]|uniref:Uncharacterized protein n=1 Tax=Podospora pseudocomata TaxID=2093779 RepID=A0ABR0GYS9_9PEZI|nr:hypothetical protein QC762_0023000 [Podospora pseudocomata]
MLSYPSSSVSAIREHRDGSVGAPCAKRQQLGSKPWCLKLLPLASFLHLGFPSSSKFIWPSSNRLLEPPIQKTSFCHKEIHHSPTALLYSTPPTDFLSAHDHLICLLTAAKLPIIPA